MPGTSAPCRISPSLLRQQGHAEQAEHWQREAFAAGQIRKSHQEIEYAGDPDLREHLARKAAGGDVAAMRGLGHLCEQKDQTEQAERWYRQAASSGDTQAMRSLARLHERLGSTDLAEQWYRTAADAGDNAAMNNLALRRQSPRCSLRRTSGSFWRGCLLRPVRL